VAIPEGPDTALHTLPVKDYTSEGAIAVSENTLVTQWTDAKTPDFFAAFGVFGRPRYSAPPSLCVRQRI
jgi:hypothetical protein